MTSTIIEQPVTGAIARPVGSLTECANCLARLYENDSSAGERRKRGQFFTPPSIADFMAGHLTDLPPSVDLLDAGAGVGTLTAAVCQRIIELGEPRQITATLYETDAAVEPFLRACMGRCADALAANGHSFDYSILRADFILDNAGAVAAQPSLFPHVDRAHFDLAIMNPPYYKLNRNAPQVLAMDPVVHGQPNVYALFMAMAASLLRDGGQLVAITPRSFCSGLYFRQFRRWFFSRMQPRAIHVFGSRTDAFQEDKVLQENIIMVCDRVGVPLKSVRITRSPGRTVTQPLALSDLPYRQVVDNPHGSMVICIPERHRDRELADVVDGWPETFTKLGFAISTGPVVSFRARQFLVDAIGEQDQAVPLLWLHNVKPFEITWPHGSKGKAGAIEASTRTRRLLLPTKNYVVMKRFSAKEERRRLTAAVLLADRFPVKHIGIENHLNYVYRPDGDLTVDEAFGLAGLFNSALLDRYFRMINGNTQVNATEIRTMPMPPLDRIRAIGRELRALHDLTPSTVEEVVLGRLEVNGSLASALLETR